LEKELPEEEWVSSISACGDNFASALFSGKITVYKNQKRSAAASLSPLPLNCVKLTDELVFAGGEDTKVYVLKLGKGLINSHVLEGMNDPVTAFDLHPLNPRHVCAADNNQISFFHVPTERSSEQVQKKVKSDFQSVNPVSQQQIHALRILTLKWAQT